MNIGVASDYQRVDLDEHVAEVATAEQLDGHGVGLLTAARVDAVYRGESGGVVAHATVGVSKPTWAADASSGWNDWQPGTINTVIQVPVALEPAAAVNAVITATEAKTQAFIESGVPGTGTASDAIVVVWPVDGDTVAFAGPRSEWGGRIALATHAAIATGIDDAKKRLR